MKHLFCSSAITLISQNCSVIESSPQALNSGIIMKPFNYYVRPLETNTPIWTPPISATQISALQSLSTHFLECVSESFGHKLSSEAFCPGMTKDLFLILKFCNSFSAPALISDYKEPLETNIRHRVLLSIHFVVFLHSFPSHTVQILKESAAGSRSLELQPRSQVHPILLLQEYCPVHHRGKTHTEALSTESHAKSQMWMHSFEILFFKDANGTTT